MFTIVSPSIPLLTTTATPLEASLRGFQQRASTMPIATMHGWPDDYGSSESDSVPFV